MATTLTPDNEITQPLIYASFPIEKTETDPDGNLVVYGKASDGSVDSDQQIVSPEFARKAAEKWFSTGANIRVQHQAQRDPAGVGISYSHDGDATWVKALVVEPVAQKLVAAGALRAYSVGISRPTITRDISGKARGGIITDGEWVEVSLVDRPANKSCGLQLVKAAKDGTLEYTGTMFGDSDVITKLLASPGIAKQEHQADYLPGENLTVEFTPNDLARILKTKYVDQHYAELAHQAARGYDPFAYAEKRDFDPGVGGGVDRDKLGESDFAGPHRSFPIVNQSDVSDALRLAGHADDPDAVRARIHAIARRKGFSVPGENSDSKSKGESVTDAQVTPEAVADGSIKEAEPVITKDPADGDGPGPKGKKKPKGKKSLPPWLNQNKADAEPDEDEDGATKPAMADDCKLDHVHTEKCHTTPREAGNVKDSPDMSPAPVGDLAESPMPAGRKMHPSPETAAMLRFKTVGIDTDLGRLHDLTCPAFDPEDVAKFHPYADFGSVIDEGVWQRKALEAAAGKSIAEALEMQRMWQAAALLKSADAGDLNDYRAQLHKAFRDANPGPTSYPSPGSISPSGFCRPLITDGRSATSPGHDGPNSSPSVASGPVSGNSFDRPPLSAGHQSPSPSFMKGGMEYPAAGSMTRLNYAVMEKERARTALITLHDHLSGMFPQACPMAAQDPNAQPETRAIPQPVGKQEESPAAAAPDVAKAGKKVKSKLGRKVLSGKMTLDQARGQMGNRASRKQVGNLTAAIEKGIMSVDEARAAVLGLPPLVTKSAEPEVIKGEVLTLTASMPDPGIIKSAITEAIAPLMDIITSQKQQIAAHEERFEKLADLADPATASFSAIAVNPATRGRPGGVLDKAETAERTQRMMMRQLENSWRVSENPAEREAYYAALEKMRGE